MIRAIVTLMRFQLRAQQRSRTVWLALLGAMAVTTLGQWTGAMALTERTPLMLSMMAPWARLTCVVLTTLMVVSLVVRDIQDRSWLLGLAAPLPRAVWLVGTALGLAIGALGHAVILALPLWLVQPTSATAWWTLSLGLEAVLISSLALAAALALRQMPAAVCATLLFYLGGRVMVWVQWVSHRTPFETSGLQTVSATLIDALAVLLPRLDAMTATQWLLPQGAPISLAESGLGLAQAMLYSLIALTVARLDLHRKGVA